MSKEPDGWIPGEVQSRYARILAIGTRIGLVALVVTYALYVFGVLPSAVPLARVPELWRQSAPEYMEQVNAEFLHFEHPPYGWRWAGLAGKADYLNVVSICFLGFVTIACYLAIIPKLVAQRRRVYATIAVLEVLVLLLAASGVLTAGH